MFFTVIYTMTIQIFPCSWKNVKWKKNVYTFLIKKPAFYAGLDSKQKTFGNCQATYQKELCLLFENQQFFQSENREAWLHSPFVLVHFLRTPLHNINTFLITPNLTKSEHQNYPKPNMICVSHTKNIH